MSLARTASVQRAVHTPQLGTEANTRVAGKISEVDNSSERSRLLKVIKRRGMATVSN
jgi:hypothetical protein